jgi:hypothetical protein
VCVCFAQSPMFRTLRPPGEGAGGDLFGDGHVLAEAAASGSGVIDDEQSRDNTHAPDWVSDGFASPVRSASSGVGSSSTPVPTTAPLPHNLAGLGLSPAVLKTMVERNPVPNSPMRSPQQRGTEGSVSNSSSPSKKKAGFHLRSPAGKH